MVETQYPVAGSFGMPPPDRGYSAPVIQGPKFVNPSGGYPPDSRSLSPPPFYFLMEIPGNHPLILIKGGWHPRIWSTRKNKFRPQRISLFRISGFVLIWFASTCFPSFFNLPPPSNRLIFLTLQSCSKCFAWDPDQTLKLKRFLFFRFRFFPEWFLLSKFQHYILTF